MKEIHYCQGCFYLDGNGLCQYYKLPSYDVKRCPLWHDRTGLELPNMGWY